MRRPCCGWVPTTSVEVGFVVGGGELEDVPSLGVYDLGSVVAQASVSVARFHAPSCLRSGPIIPALGSRERHRADRREWITC